MAFPCLTKRSCLEKFCIKVLKTGEFPNHVAFIMDGNRRYAVKNGWEKYIGHRMGMQRLSKLLGWCIDLGIKEVTLYCFSIENFKRPKVEVDYFFDLMKEMFLEYLRKKDEMRQYGICVRFYGSITLFPEDLQKLLAQVYLESADNTGLYINFCIAYNAQEEISDAVKEIATSVVSGSLLECDVTEDLLSQSLYTCKSSDPDIVIRTSGEVRLSDFLLWQSTYSGLSFMKVLWPAISIWNLIQAILHFQHQFRKFQEIKKKQNVDNENKHVLDPSDQQQLKLEMFQKDMENRGAKFLYSLHKKRHDELLQM